VSIGRIVIQSAGDRKTRNRRRCGLAPVPGRNPVGEKSRSGGSPHCRGCLL